MLVRPSGTEPLIRVMVEADDEVLLERGARRGRRHDRALRLSARLRRASLRLISYMVELAPPRAISSVKRATAGPRLTGEASRIMAARVRSRWLCWPRWLARRLPAAPDARPPRGPAGGGRGGRRRRAPPIAWASAPDCQAKLQLLDAGRAGRPACRPSERPPIAVVLPGDPGGWDWLALPSVEIAADLPLEVHRARTPRSGRRRPAC